MAKAKAGKKTKDTSEADDMIRAKQDAFLAALGDVGSIRKACEASGVGRSTVTGWSARDVNGFRTKVRVSKELFREHLQDMALERIKNQKPNDNPILLVTLLNAEWPEKYRRDGNMAGTEVKEMMADWKRWVKENNKKSKKDPGVTEADEAHRNAIDEVEKILLRKKESDGKSK